MKYILAILILTTAAFADISHSFTLLIQTDGYGAKTNTATWAGSRGASSSNVTSTTGDTLTVYSWCSDLATDTFKVARAYLWSDTINSNSYIDSINDIAAGNSVRFDSIELKLTAFHAADLGGCTGQVYLFIHDSCYVFNNYNVGQAYTSLTFNDVISPLTATAFPLCDSIPIDTNTFGMAGTPTVVTFTVKDRAILDDIECHISAGSTPNSIGFGLMSCYDYSNTQPTPQTSYNTKVSFYALENAGADPYAKVYWTEVEPVTNAERSLWRKVWNSWRIW